MDICRLQIEIFMIFMMIVVIIFVMSMSMIFTVSEYKGTDYIDDKSRNCDYKSYIIVYGKRRYESFYRKTSYK